MGGGGGFGEIFAPFWRTRASSNRKENLKFKYEE